MRVILLRLLSILLLMPLSGCADAGQYNGFDVNDSLVPVSQIYQGGPPRDGIPSLDEPNFVSDMLLYDRETDSLWSQLMEQAISGPLKGVSRVDA